MRKSATAQFAIGAEKNIHLSCKKSRKQATDEIQARIETAQAVWHKPIQTMILYQKTEDPLVIVTDSKTKDVQTKKLTGTYFRIIPPANDRVNWVLTCSEMHVDRWASATDSTMIISENLRNQLVALFQC